MVMDNSLNSKNKPDLFNNQEQQRMNEERERERMSKGETERKKK